MVKKQHIARQTEYTATHMGNKTLKSQRMHNHRDGQQENDRVRGHPDIRWPTEALKIHTSKQYKLLHKAH